MKIGKALSWDELADLYDEANHSTPARTLSMFIVWDWAEGLPDRFYVNTKEGTIHQKEA
jgi:hypothetical protein